MRPPSELTLVLSVLSGFFLAAVQATFFQTAVDKLLLQNGHQVTDDIVQHQT